MPSIRQSNLYAALALIVLALVCLHAGYSLPATVRHNTGVTTLMQQHIWLDNLPRAYGDASGRTGIFTATMNRSPSGMVWIENTFHADVTLILNGQTVYEGSESTAVTLPPDAGYQVELRYHLPDTFPPRSRLGLMQIGLFGQTYVQPAWDYLPPSIVQDIARTGFWIFAALALAAVVSAVRLPRRRMLALVALWLLALTIQGVTMHEKLEFSDAHWTMENTWDNYLTLGRDWTSGRIGIFNQAFQIANFVYIGTSQIVFEPDVTTLYGINSIIGSFVPVLMALAAYALFRRWSTGIATGLIAALFMALVHFEQTIQPEGVANIMLALMLCSVVMLYRRPALIWAIIAGLMVGICGALRASALLLILWVGLVLLFNGIAWRRKFAYGITAGIAAIVIMSPIYHANFSHQIYMFTPTRSDNQLFVGNGLDATGLASYGGITERLMLLKGGRNWNQALMEDIRRDPPRVFELVLRRLGLIFQSEEHGDADQVDYEKFSLRVSPTTQLLSLNGAVTSRTILVLAISGLLLALIEKRREVWILIPPILLWSITLLAFFALARIRIGMAAFLLPLAGFALDQFRLYLVDNWRRFIAGLALVAVVNGAILWSADWLVANFPRVQLVAENDLPPQLIPVRAVYGGEMQLLGYAFYESDNRPDGFVIFELFWQALTKPTEDYIVTLRLVNTATDEVESVQNFPQGLNTAPTYPSTAMNPGEILFERYLMRLPKIEDARDYAIYVGLYSNRKQTVLPVTDATTEIQGNHIRLTAVQVNPAAPEPELAESNAVWDGKLALLDTTCTPDGDSLKLAQDWQIVERIPADWHYFVHIYQGDTFITQHDSRLDELHPPDGLPKFARLTTNFTLPDVPGADNVRIGFYNPVDMSRLPVNAVDGLVQDDTLRIECGK